MATTNNLGELLPIRESNGQRAVNARDLHAFLESKQDFSTWIKARIEQYGFVENQDYQILAPQNYGASWGGNNKVEYALSIDMAKELSMVEKTKKGKEARSYFIDCERVANEKLAIDKQPTISDKMKVATWLIKTLNLDEHSKLAIAKSIAEPLGLPTPEYVEEEVMLPISKILSRNGISISPQKANKKLLELGLLEQVERYSKRKGRNEQKYIISEKGKKFGKMHQFKDASFPSPAWFVDKSDDLINLLTNTTTGGLAYGE